MSLRSRRDKVVLITGAGSGLGAATAHVFAQEGWAVACLDLDGDSAERVSQTLRASGAESIALPCDVSDARAVAENVEMIVQHYGRLDVVVNNAGIDYTLPIEEMTVEQWDRVIAVNLRGPFLVAKAALPVMKRQGGGHIVNIASTAATRAWANASAYHASKWGLLGFSRSLSVEGRPCNVRVTTIIPGGMRTRFFDRFLDQGIPLPDEQNLQDPADVARVILFAVTLPAGSVVQEVIVTPLGEPSWP